MRLLCGVALVVLTGCQAGIPDLRPAPTAPVVNEVLPQADVSVAPEANAVFGQASLLAGTDVEIIDSSTAGQSGVDATPQIVAPEAAAQSTRRGGLFGRLRGNRSSEATNQIALKASPEEASPPRRRTISTVAPGETVAFGKVGIACEASRSTLGRQVDQFPREGRAVWQLHDTNPDSTALRTQYITGFKDGCPRQITAALVVFGAASVHEAHRYSSLRSQASWSQADTTYEDIKVRACGVGRAVHCPENKLNRLENKLAFVSVYPAFGVPAGQLELLLHDGELRSEQVR